MDASNATSPGPGDGSAETVDCPHCGSTAPGSPFCGACGAHLARSHAKTARRRLHSYAAFPDEPVLRLGVVSSLLPQLSSRSRAPFRAAFTLVVVVLVALAIARLGAALIAVSALAIPLLFLCYLAEIHPPERRFVAATAGVLLAGAGLGVAFAFLLGRTVSNALLPGVSPSLTSGSVLRSAVLAPVVLQLLMIVPVALLRLQRPVPADAVDGFTAGATGALGLSAALTLTELASGVHAGNIDHGSVLSILSEAVVRGVSAPLVGAATSGYVGATLWRHNDRRTDPGARWLTSPLVALAVALLIQVGLGFADSAGLFDGLLVVVYIAAALLALAVLRIGLHHVLLHEQQELGIGGRRLCPHCLHEVPSMPFCPMCGVSEKATALRPAPLHGRGRTAATLESTGAPSAVPSTATPLSTAAPPTSTPLHQAAAAPRGAPADIHELRHLGHARLLLAVLAGLGISAGLFALLAVALPTKPQAPCLTLRCFTPYGPVPVQRGTPYASSDGWGLTWYPASAVLPGAAPATAATASSDQLKLAFSSSVSSAEDGELFFVGEPARGESAAQLVTALQQANAPNATLDYVLPNPTIGYHLGYGASFETTPNSSDGYGVTFEVVITCAVVNGYAVCAYGVGPRVNLNQIVNHPTPAKLALSLWSDPDANSVYWKDTGSR